MNIAIYIYDEVEVLDFSGPYDVFSTAMRVFEIEKKSEKAKAVQVDSAEESTKKAPHVEPPFRVFLVGETAKTVHARNDFRVVPHYDFDSVAKIDVLVVPGGFHVDEMKKTKVAEWIGRTAQQAKLTASICTGAFLLAQAGVITDHRVTTHFEDIEDLKTLFPKLQVEKNTRYIDAGDVVTSAGISAGIDMSLYLVECLFGRSLAVKTAKKMEYHWQRIEE